MKKVSLQPDAGKGLLFKKKEVKLYILHQIEGAIIRNKLAFSKRDIDTFWQSYMHIFYI